jgi:hypothetical protein
MPTAANEVAGTSRVPDGPGAAMPWPSRPGVVIALGTAVALALRLYQLFRPGYLSGFTQYDDGVYFGNAVRLVDGAIPYRDFAMVQPPGSMLLMAPVALLAKAFGTVWGLGAARLLTAGADAANAMLIGLLVRHRGVLAAGLACAGYGVYPAALNASSSLFLEPWLNLFCLLGTLMVFKSGQLAGPRSLAWGGAWFGFAVAVKIWAFVPALLAGGLCVRGRTRGAWFAGGFAAGLAVWCLPFLVLAPSGFGRTVFVSELIQATHGRFGPKPRLADITGLTGLAGFTGGVSPLLGAAIAVSVVIGVLIAAAWILSLARRGKGLPGRGLTALDWYVLLGASVITLMMFAPSEWYQHYAAFDGPFLVLVAALPLARLAVGTRIRPAAVVAAGMAVAVVGGLTVASVVATVKHGPVRSYASVAAIIPPGACVVTDTASATIAINRFDSSAPGCPLLVDSVGTLIARTDGQDLTAGPALLAADTAVWQTAFARAQYVWLVGNDGYTGARIAWTWSLYHYFISHFRHIAFFSGFRGHGDVPHGGLYIRTLRSPGNESDQRIVW